MANFSKYQISWIVLTPKTGKATKRDQKIFNSQISFASGFSLGPFSQNLFAYFPSKEIAEKHLNELSKANKDYDAVIITDAQFGKMIIDYNTRTAQIEYTEKQISETKTI